MVNLKADRKPQDRSQIGDVSAHPEFAGDVRHRRAAEHGAETELEGTGARLWLAPSAQAQSVEELRRLHEYIDANQVPKRTRD